MRVRLEGCGVCASNLSPWEGEPWFTYPFEPGALGHEGWGRVDAVGAGVTGFERRRPGRDAVRPRLRRVRRRARRAPSSSCPTSLDGQPFPGEPLGCAVNIFRRSGIRPGQTVAIVGIGFLGALLTRLASQAGARVLAVARRPFAQAVARDMGAAESIPMDDHWQIIERVKALTDGASATW